MKTYSTIEVAKLLHCSRQRVGELREKGYLPMVKFGHGWVALEKDIEELFKKHKYEDILNG